MKVDIVKDETRRMFDIYVSMSRSDSIHDYSLTADGVWTLTEVGTIRPKFLSLDYDLYEAIIREAMGHQPYADFDVIRDCREVRDRLLTLVEEGWTE